MQLFFKNSQGQMREIVKLDDYNLTNGELFNAAMSEIEAFCSERNFKIHYTRLWNTKQNDSDMTVFDVGSHTEFFYLDPPLDIESLRGGT